jgi:hypothetical protein
MEIIKELQKQENMEDYKDDNRVLNSIKAGKYKLSIQGSNSAYSSPRITLPVECYSKMELAIFNNKGWLCYLRKSKVLKKFPKYNELLDRVDGINSKAPVFGYVSINLLNELYLYLINPNS